MNTMTKLRVSEVRSGFRNLRPIHKWPRSTFRVRRRPGQLTTDQWIDLLIRSIGLEPSGTGKAAEAALFAQVIPLIQPNYNLVELGPRETGEEFRLPAVVTIRHSA